MAVKVLYSIVCYVICLQLEVWVGCFYRNTAPMQITNGGKPAEYFQQCIIMEEIIGKISLVIPRFHLNLTVLF